MGGVVKRREDPRLITGRGLYTGDVAKEGWLHAAFVRSTLAHAHIMSIDRETAAAMPGVVAVLVAADLGLKPQESPTMDAFARPPLAADVVRFVGDLVAVVVGESRAQAADAAEAVRVEYDTLPAVVDPADALAPGAPILHDAKGDNLAAATDQGDPDVLVGAEVVVRARFINQRLAAVPIEANAVAAEPDGDGGLRLWVSTQVPFRVRVEVPQLTGISEESLRVIAPDVGGAFGAKLATYPEQSIIAMTHGRAQLQDVALGATRDGQLVGLDVNILGDAGAYPGLLGSGGMVYTAQISPGVDATPKVHFQVRSAATNTTVVSAYRGAGRPEAVSLIERVMDMLAMELDIDPVELRRRNLISGDFPYTTATGLVYDSGDYR